jgi:DNA-binding transcriptional ArsR family regulator
MADATSSAEHFVVPPRHRSVRAAAASSAPQPHPRCRPLADHRYVHDWSTRSGRLSLVSQHCALRGTGLVRTRRRGREVVYELTDVHAAHIVRDAVAHA